MIALERTPPPTRLLHNIERIQGWSMLLYCPIEAVAYLAGHSILSLSPKTQNRLWLISARFWALYVGLQLLHLVEDNRLLRLRARALERSRGHPTPVPRAQQRAGATDVEKTAAAVSEEQQLTRRMWNELDERKEAIMNELWVNLGYLPLTVHWYVLSTLPLFLLSLSSCPKHAYTRLTPISSLTHPPPGPSPPASSHQKSGSDSSARSPPAQG